MQIRAEAPTDDGEIDEITLAAFARYPGNGTIETKLIRLLRDHPSWIPELSLVAEEGGRIVGHILLTRAAVGDQPVLALGPISVRPDRQRSGVGSALMTTAIDLAKTRGETLIALLGDPAYYSRFGFVLGSEAGVTSGVPEWEQHFQVLALGDSPTGEFRYPQPFYELD